MSKPAFLDALAPGDVIIADAGFTCMAPGPKLVLRSVRTGELYVLCKEGRHDLEGQMDARGYLVGFTLLPESGE